MKSEFLEWFVGFADAEGNFNIRLTNLSDNTYKSAQFTFQIGLHKDEIEVLEYIGGGGWWVRCMAGECCTNLLQW